MRPCAAPVSEEPDEDDEDWDFGVDDELIAATVDCVGYTAQQYRGSRGSREPGRRDFFLGSGSTLLEADAPGDLRPRLDGRARPRPRTISSRVCVSRGAMRRPQAVTGSALARRPLRRAIISGRRSPPSSGRSSARQGGRSVADRRIWSC